MFLRLFPKIINVLLFMMELIYKPFRLVVMVLSQQVMLLQLQLLYTVV